MSEVVSAGQLRSFVERIERVDEEIRAMNTDKKEIYAEAKGNGFDVKILKKVVRLRGVEESDRAEQNALLDVYLDALGMKHPGEDIEAEAV